MNGSSGSDADVTVDQVLQVIHRLHGASSSPPSLEEQRHLQQVLFTAQQSQSGWTFGGQLLSGTNANINVRFFGAHTFAIKINRDWNTLPQEHWLPLKDALLGWLAESAARAYPANGPSIPGERIVTRKLAVAITNVSFRLAPRYWQEWIQDTLSRLDASGTSKAGCYEFLTLAGEEIGRGNNLTSTLRVQYDAAVAAAGPTIAGLLHSTLTLPVAWKEGEINAALECLQAWVVKRDLNRNLLGELYDHILPYLAQEATCVAACACIEDIILDMTFATAKRVDPLMDFVASDQVLQIFENARHEADVDDLSQALFKLLVAVFEHSYSAIIASVTSSRSIALLQRLHLLTSFPGYFAMDESISDLALPIWAYLQEDISDNGIVASASGYGDARWPVVEEVFTAVVAGLRQKVQYPPLTVYAATPKDIRQTFIRYRNDVGDCLIAAYYVLREPMLGRLVSDANAAVMQLLQTPKTAAEPAEAALFGIAAIADAVSEDEDTHLKTLFQGPMLQIPSLIHGAHAVRLKRTVFRVIEGYASWFKENSAYILPAVQATITGLSDTATCQAAALALAALCNTCRKDLTDHVSSFASLVNDLEGRLPDADFVKVLGSVAAVIQALPPEQLVVPVVALVENAIAKLVQALQGPSVADARNTTLLQLACLTACARNLSEPDDEILTLDGLTELTEEAEKAKVVQADPRVDGLRSHLLEAITAISSAFRGDAEVAHALSGFLKACTATNIATPLSLPPVSLLMIIAGLIETEASSVWFSIAGLIVFRMGKQKLVDHDRMTVFQSLRQCLAKGISALPNLASMEHHPDVVQAYMDFAQSILTTSPEFLSIQPDICDTVVALSVQGLEVQERVGLQKSIQLMTSFVNESGANTRSSAIILECVQKHGNRAIENTLAGIGGKLPRSNLGFLSELLLAFSRRMPLELRLWLQTLFAIPSFPSGRVSQEQKDRFAKTVMSARSLKKLKDASESFAIVARGLEGTTYASG